MTRAARPFERSIQNEIRLHLSRVAADRVVTWRNNRGVAVSANGGRVEYGLAPGASDLIGIYHGSAGGIFVALEIKRPGEHPTEEQARFGALVQRRGGEFAVLRSVVDAERWLEQMEKRHGRAA